MNVINTGLVEVVISLRWLIDDNDTDTLCNFLSLPSSSVEDARDKRDVCLRMERGEREGKEEKDREKEGNERGRMAGRIAQEGKKVKKKVELGEEEVIRVVNDTTGQSNDAFSTELLPPPIATFTSNLLVDRAMLSSPGTTAVDIAMRLGEEEGLPRRFNGVVAGEIVRQCGESVKGVEGVGGTMKSKVGVEWKGGKKETGNKVLDVVVGKWCA